MRSSLLTRICLLGFLCAGCALTVEKIRDDVGSEKEVQGHVVLSRTKRGFFGKGGFIPTLFSVVYDQWRDSKDTYNSINKMINDNFLDENAPVEVVTQSSDPNVTTTKAPYRISRKEFQKILRRNIKGIQRLLRIELNDAYKQSQETEKEFRKNYSLEVGKFL